MSADISIATPHSIRAVTTSTAFANGVPIEEIPEELREIEQYKPVILADISDDVAEYLRTLNGVSYRFPTWLNR